MGMFLKLWALIMGMIMAFFSAKAPAKAYEPETVVINGVTYKNCFIPEYAYLNAGKIQFDTNEPFYTEESGLFRSKTDWYKINDKLIICGRDVLPILETPGTVYYCRESDWNELKAYYSDMNNWRFFAGTSYVINGKKPDPIEIERNNNNLELWAELMQFTFDCNNNNDRQSEMKKQGLYYELPQKINAEKYGIYFYMQSDDELFSAGTGCGDVIDYEGTLYLRVVSVGDMYDGAYKLPAELQSFIRELDEKCDFSSFYLPVY